jgi:putative ABC transport system permease protein
MAWRNLWRNARRSVVTVGAMTLGLWVMILYSGLINGMIRDMGNDVLDFEVGDIQIHASGYADDPSIYSKMEDADHIVEALEKKGYRATARLLGGGLVASGEASAGANLRGVDPTRDRNTLKTVDRLAHGEWLSADDPKGVVLGRRLAKALDASVDSELIVLTQGADGSMANDLYRVRGVLGSVGEGTDRAAVFMTEGTFRELMVLPTGAHQIILRVPDIDALDAHATDVATVAPDHVVQTWSQILPLIAQWMGSAKAAVYFMSFIIYIAIGILILNAMLMAVFERIREFGVLKAIGVSPWAVFRLILIESGMQVSIAICVGTSLAIPAAWAMTTIGLDVGSLGGTSMMGLTMRPRWYGEFTAESFLAPIMVMLIIVGTAILYPALKAAWIRPLTAMRHQ